MFSKIDRAMVNEGWRDMYENALVFYLPEGDFDHCPGVVSANNDQNGRKPFIFFNMWTIAPGYKTHVERIWQHPIRGCMMYGITQRLKLLKKELKIFNKQGFSDVHAAAIQAEQRLLNAQAQMHARPDDTKLASIEK